jgi:hypothetical protein
MDYLRFLNCKLDFINKISCVIAIFIGLTTFAQSTVNKIVSVSIVKTPFIINGKDDILFIKTIPYTFLIQDLIQTKKASRKLLKPLILLVARPRVER